MIRLLSQSLIGDFALLASNTTVLPGVVIPEGMSIGAFTLVNKKEYKEWSLYLEIPCRFHAKRDGSIMREDVKRLLNDRIILV